MFWLNLLLFYLKFYSLLQIVNSNSKFGVVKDMPAILNYEDPSLFDGVPVKHSNRYRRNEQQTEHDEEETLKPGGTTATNAYHNVRSNDNMNFGDRRAMVSLIEEIIQDAEYKVHEVGLIINMHKAATSFEVGKIIGLIQCNYRHQMEMYRELSNKEVRFGYRARTRIWPAAWHASYQQAVYARHEDQKLENFARMNDYYMLIYFMLFEIERDIDHLIDMLNAIPRSDLQLAPSTMKQSSPPKFGHTASKRITVSKRDRHRETKAQVTNETMMTFPKDMTTPPGFDPNNIDSKMYANSTPSAPPEYAKKSEEDDLEDLGFRAKSSTPKRMPDVKTAKSKKPRWRPGGALSRRHHGDLEMERYKHRVREQYLLKRLGLNESGHTEKPRFRLGWPVEETWDNIPLY